MKSNIPSEDIRPRTTHPIVQEGKTYGSQYCTVQGVYATPVKLRQAGTVKRYPFPFP